MALLIFDNPAENTHENTQFRRVAKMLKSIFENRKLNGILIGNPYNELFARFRADAILYYDNGFIIIDFKEYSGTLIIPKDETDFRENMWFLEQPDKQRIQVKGGSYINPFKQLFQYRKVFQEIVKSNVLLQAIDYSKVCIANLFSGPIDIINETPKDKPYYKILQESDLGNFIYDFKSKVTSYQEDAVSALRKLFPCEEYILDNNAQINQTNQIKDVEDASFEEKVKYFLSNSNEKICLLKSIDQDIRDSWVRFIENKAIESNYSQVEKWSHSSRIARLIQKRSGINTIGIYGAIYGGWSNNIDEKEDDVNYTTGESDQNVVPIKNLAEDIDEKTLIMILDAHLISRSFNQSELLRFGSGRLLQDIYSAISFLKEYKIIFIGDPYSLTYGSDEDSSMCTDTLMKTFGVNSVVEYSNNKLKENDCSSKNYLRVELANSIKKQLFNHLSYSYDNISLTECEEDMSETLFRSWYANSNSSYANKILFFRREDCTKANLWIKKYCLKNGEKLAAGDLMILENNIMLPNESAFMQPTRIYNGSYLVISSIGKTVEVPVIITQSKTPIALSFTKVSAILLEDGGKKVDFVIFDNYFKSTSDLSKEEKIAFNNYVNKKLIEMMSNEPFVESVEYRNMLGSDVYLSLSKEDQDAVSMLVSRDNKVSTKQAVRSFVAKYRRKYKGRLLATLRNCDIYVNAANVRYGWSITVHKAIGAQYDNVIIKGFRKENDGICNENYYRWLYSGITCAKTVYINSPQVISPMMKCQVDESLHSFKQSPSLIKIDNYTIPERFCEQMKGIENLNVQYVICEISTMLNSIGLQFNKIGKCSDYLTKAYYRFVNDDKDSLILDVDNKGAKDSFAVANIRIEKTENLETSEVLKIITRIKAGATSNTSKTDLVINDKVKQFREIEYHKWESIFMNNKFSLSIIESHQYQDIFEAKKDSNFLTFRVWYSLDCFFSKIELLNTNIEDRSVISFLFDSIINEC